jgi:hypothetical protein
MHFHNADLCRLLYAKTCLLSLSFCSSCHQNVTAALGPVLTATVTLTGHCLSFQVLLLQPVAEVQLRSAAAAAAAATQTVPAQP